MLLLKRFIALVALLVMPVVTWGAITPSSSMKTATVFIANYNSENDFVGWGSGFYVDEKIVVTNKHVIEAGNWYRVYATGTDDQVNFDCFQAITKSDVRVNLDDDVAYMRAYLPCEHGTLNLAEDPENGDEVAVIGYPSQGLSSTAVRLTVSTGAVMAHMEGEWRRTSAYLDVGNSGGPVVNESEAVGVAVAKGLDEDGNYVTGFFIPSSVILNGLLHANDSRFGYIPQVRSSSSRRSSSQASSASSSSAASSQSSKESASSMSSRPRSAASSSRSSRQSSTPQIFRDVRPSRAGYEAIQSLYQRGVIEGYANGTFRPGGSINRAEFLKILVAGFRSTEAKGEARCFTDVTAEWFAEYVCAAKRLGWIEGYADGSFKPAQQINRAEAMKILTVAFGRTTVSLRSLPPDVSAEAWYATPVALGIQIGIVNPRTLFWPAENLTREDGAIWIDGATR